MTPTSPEHVGTVIDRFRTDGRVVVVTGASSGLGIAIARAFADAGALLAIGARRTDRLDAVADNMPPGTSVLAERLDVSDPRSCASFCDQVSRHFGRIDILINNAGVGGAAPASREPTEEFAQTVHVNLLGAYSMAREAAKHMERGGSVVNISSVLASTSFYGLPQAAYCSSKAGIEGLTRDLAQQWTGRKGIRVNAVAPGLFPTEMSEEYPESFLTDMANSRIPAGRLGDLDECAAATLFLASDASSYISGVVLPVDGGLLTT